MKIVFVGGGTGGHFYPLIAVAEEINKYVIENKLSNPKLYYIAPKKYDEKALFDAGISFIPCPAGKIRRTTDIVSKIKNFFSFFSVAIGIFNSLVVLYIIFPDVIFSKGGYASFPILFAARILRIPVVSHESDSKLGKVTKYFANYSKHIAISYPEAEEELTQAQKTKTALTGIPVRPQLLYNPIDNAYELLGLDKNKKTILILGGSSGAEKINDLIFDVLRKLLSNYQVIHITGKDNENTTKREAKSFLGQSDLLKSYKVVGFVNAYYLRAFYTIADLVITRAGSTTLTEIAVWGKASIVIPIKEEVSHDQVSNAYAYSSITQAPVIEEKNLLPSIFLSQIENILENKENLEQLEMNAKKFAKKDAAQKIAKLLVSILKTHES